MVETRRMDPHDPSTWKFLTVEEAYDLFDRAVERAYEATDRVRATSRDPDGDVTEAIWQAKQAWLWVWQVWKAEVVQAEERLEWEIETLPRP